MPSSRSQYVARTAAREVETAFRLLDWAEGTPVGVTVCVLKPSGEVIGAMALQTAVKRSAQYFARVPLVLDVTAGEKVKVTVTVMAGPPGPPAVSLPGTAAA